jgi:histidyl-tRNA synthetase
MKERPLRKQMEYAAAIKARLVVIVGPREIKEGETRIRDMKLGQEKVVKMTCILEHASALLLT